MGKPPDELDRRSLVWSMNRPLDTFNQALGRIRTTAPESPEHLAAQAQADAALVDLEGAVRAWVAKFPAEGQTPAQTEDLDRAVQIREERLRAYHEACYRVQDLEMEHAAARRAQKAIARAVAAGASREFCGTDTPTPHLEHLWGGSGVPVHVCPGFRDEQEN